MWVLRGTGTARLSVGLVEVKLGVGVLPIFVELNVCTLRVGAFHWVLVI